MHNCEIKDEWLKKYTFYFSDVKKMKHNNYIMSLKPYMYSLSYPITSFFLSFRCFYCIFGFFSVYLQICIKCLVKCSKKGTNEKQQIMISNNKKVNIWPFSFVFFSIELKSFCWQILCSAVPHFPLEDSQQSSQFLIFDGITPHLLRVFFQIIGNFSALLLSSN